MTPLQRLTCLASVLLCLAAVPASASARVARDFIGIASPDVFAGSADYRATNLSAQATLGIGLIRQTFDWSQIETAPGSYSLGAYDEYVATAAAHGIRILPVLFNAPSFRSRAPAHQKLNGTYPPRKNADLGRFGAVLARRYGPGGSLWRERPEVPYTPIRAWQIWNEPNLPVYWLPRPNARAYTRLLRVAGRAIKRVDRHAEIVTAGMPESKQGVPLKKYLTALYRAHAKSAFDTMAINTYARNERDLARNLTAIRKLMNHFHDRRARIWATEIGWSDRGPGSAFRAGVKGQAKRINRAYATVSKLRRRLHLRGIVYFSWRDSAPYAPRFQDFWGLHTGLLRLNGTPKPGFFAFKHAASKLR